MRQNKEKNLKQNKRMKGEENSSKIKETKKQTKSRKIFFIKLIIIILIIALVVGIIYLSFKAYTFNTLVREMFNNTPSTVFDSNKNEIAQIGTERNRENVNFSNIPDQLVNAYVSIEDQRFYKHNGIDIKRTGAAILSYIVKFGSTSFGGSTITQQLVKNLTGDDSNSIFRKVREWFYAWVLDSTFSKDEILEAYLNIIYTGPNIYGVQEAAHYYFSKNISDLSLAECAYLAGINNAPNSYNPFSDTDKTERINNRTKTVLDKMLELEYITQDEYNSAISEVDNGLNFKKGEITTDSNVYSYHTDALINEVISDLSDKKHISQDFATNFFYMSGVSIYSTENTEIQTILENEAENKKYVLKSSNGEDTSQSAMVVIDHTTGYVVACTRRFR